MSTEDLERVVRTGTSVEVLALVDKLDNEATGAQALRALAGSRHSDVRAWVAWAVLRILRNSDGIALLEDLSSDRHPDVQDAAIESLLSLGPEQANALLPRLRKRLRSADHWTPVLAMWSLARLRDAESLPLIAQIEAHPIQPWHAQEAEIVRLLMTGKADDILQRLAAHDHDSTAALAHAALFLATTEATAALRECESKADPQCQNLCRRALERISPVAPLP